MVTLTLMRHAKSNWALNTPGQAPPSDKLRPLASRGVRDAPRMAAWMQQNKIQPDLVLCSTALRTQQTFALIKTAITTETTTIDMKDELYLADAGDIIARIKLLSDAHRHVLVVGHNPGLHDAALFLIGAGASAARRALVLKFPTAGVAIIDFAFSRWRSLAGGTGTLRHFMAPKLLVD